MTRSVIGHDVTGHVRTSINILLHEGLGGERDGDGI